MALIMLYGFTRRGVGVRTHFLSVAMLWLVAGLGSAPAYDVNNDGYRDIWQWVYGAGAPSAQADSDGDGLLNWQEQKAGTDPLQATSTHEVVRGAMTTGRVAMAWNGLRGKAYDLLATTNLFPPNWTLLTTWTGQASEVAATLNPAGDGLFYSVEVRDLDTDNDGIFDWEEYQVGLDPRTNRSQRSSTTDSNQVRNASRGTNWINVGTTQPITREDYPGAAIFSVRRTGRLDRVSVAFTVGGTATPGADYDALPPSITLEPGQREAWLELTALPDAENETDETVTLTLLTSTNYRLGPSVTATVTLQNASTTPDDRAAARLLIQASFGPSTGSLAAVRAAGLEGWLDQQLALPPTYHRPYWTNVVLAYTNVYADHKMLVWWDRAMSAPDQLRQRMAYALSQILVVSDAASTLEGEQECVLSYYDTLVQHAFGNYRDLLMAVTLHPAMGIYLSHLGNRKPDPAAGTFPDENYAREIMQLFTIGLWQLNPDGTRILTNGAPIPTYSNNDISQFARVFTGLSYGSGNTTYWWEFFWPEIYDLTLPMKMWSTYHDTDPKTLLRGTVLASNQPPMQDVEAAIDNLFQHPNTGPFITYRLIQRLVTSNPSTGYVARVAAVFANNGSGVRGDLAAVTRAILLDPEARDPALAEAATYGKQREPYLRLVNLARAFEARATNGFYELWYLDEMVGMQPMSSPSVFNFYSPDYSPNGPVKDAGLVAPEFQITTAVTGINHPNHVRTCTEQAINRWPGGGPNDVKLYFTHELPLAGDPDALLRRLDLLLTGGRLRPEQHQIVREAIQKIAVTDPTNRVRMAVYLLTTSPEFCIQK